MNKVQYLIECNFNSDCWGQKLLSDVSYIKCNDANLILLSYKNLKLNKDAIINTDQGAVYFAYEYVELA